MKTYQDWSLVADKDEKERMAFIYSAINEFKSTDEYDIAVDAEEYYKGLNPTIMRYEKFIFNALGQAVKDDISPNHKIVSKIFKRLIIQQDLVLLGNGVTWDKEDTIKKLGKNFDRQLYKAARASLVERASYGFFNVDHVDIFEYREFCALLDEEDGSIKAGIRFWQLEDGKPLRATMYELDGYTEYIWRTRVITEDGVKKTEVFGEVLRDKRAYKITVEKSNSDDVADIVKEENYDSFPIVPLYANEDHQSEIIGQRGKIDAFDLISSGYVNAEDANFIYWTISNAGGMDDRDMLKVLDKLRKINMAQVEDDAQLTPHTIDAPFLGREAILERLEKQIYRDSMALNTYDIAAGAVTATQIEASYEPLNQKLDLFEMQILDFLDEICKLAGITDENPTFTRSKIVNKSEEIGMVLQSAQYLGQEYVTEKVLTILGDKDALETVKEGLEEEEREKMALFAMQQGASMPPEEGEEEQAEESEEGAEGDTEMNELTDVVSALEDLLAELEG